MNYSQKIYYQISDNIINSSVNYNTLRECIYSRQAIYTESQMGISLFLIIYGRVTLKTKAEGVFKECLMGEFLGEDYFITQKEDKRQETVRAVEETCILEFTQKDFDLFKSLCLKDHLREDFNKILSLIKRSYLSKKSSKQSMAVRIEAPQFVY